MANGTLGSLVTNATDKTFSVYKVPTTGVEITTVNINIATSIPNATGTLRLKPASSQTLTTGIMLDFMKTDSVGAVLYRTGQLLSPGDEIIFTTDYAGFEILVSGIEQPQLN